MINLFLLLNHSVILVHEDIWRIFHMHFNGGGHTLCSSSSFFFSMFLLFFFFFQFLRIFNPMPLDHLVSANSFIGLGVVKLSFQILVLETTKHRNLIRSKTVRKFSLLIRNSHHYSYHLFSALPYSRHQFTCFSHVILFSLCGHSELGIHLTGKETDKRIDDQPNSHS